LRPVVGPLDAAPVIRGQELVHRVVRGVFVLGVRDDVAVLELVIIVIVIAVNRRARGLGLCSRLQLDKGIIIRRVLTVEIVVVGLGGGLLHLVLGAIVVVLTLGLRPVVGPLDAAPVIRGQELVHRVVRGVFVLGVSDDVAVLELVVIVIVIAVNRRARDRGLLRRLQLDEGIPWGVLVPLDLGSNVALPHCLRAVASTLGAEGVI